MPKYFDFKVCGYYLYLQVSALLNVCMYMLVIKDFQKRVQQSFL